MAFNPTAYSTQQFETLNGAIADTAGASIPPGAAVKFVGLPTAPAKVPNDQYTKVDVAGDKDEIYGVVSPLRTGSGIPITDITPGRVVRMNSASIPVILMAAGKKGDKVKVKNAKGEWGPIAAGETPLAILEEDAAMGSLAWATRIL